MYRNIFPNRYYARENGYLVESIELAKKVWQRLPERKPWYAADMEILSPTSIRLFIYDMADSYSGGIGKRIFEKVIDKLTPDEQIILDRMVMAMYSYVAERQLRQTEQTKRDKKILKLRRKMFGV